MRRFAYGFVAIAAAFAFTACSDDDNNTTPDGGPDPDGTIILKEGGTGNEASVTPDQGPQCDATMIGKPCNPTANDCGNAAICLPFDDTTGICTCECMPDDPNTPLIVEDNCPDQAYNTCGTVPLADGSDIGLCLKKCDPKIGANDCQSPISCHPMSGLEVGIYDSPVCLFPGCDADDQCQVLSSEECKTDGTVACTDTTAKCLPREEGGLDGLCVLPGKCDLTSGNCGPRENNFNADAKIGDPCQDDTECGATMACERETDMADYGVATGPCTENGDCCSGRCDATTGQCQPGTCSIHSRNGYCYQQFCAFDSLTEFACPTGSICNKFYSVGLCQKSCTLDDASSCRGVTGDLNGDFECRSYNNFNQFFESADGPTCDWGDMVDCTVFGITDINCSFFGLGAGNDTNMRCLGLDGADKTDPRDSTGFCLDDTASGTAWR